MCVNFLHLSVYELIKKFNLSAFLSLSLNQFGDLTSISKLGYKQSCRSQIWIIELNPRVQALHVYVCVSVLWLLALFSVLIQPPFLDCLSAVDSIKFLVFFSFCFCKCTILFIKTSLRDVW